jgi:diadenosine tetraphosphate (Ap4A) HIT family hydrolase
MKNCDFCNELNGMASRFHSLYPALRARTFRVSQNFTIIPTLGQLDPTHLLIVSNEHRNSIAQLPAAEQQELWSIAEKVRGIFREFKEDKQYNTMFFEHGVFDDSGVNGGCGVSHLHLHALLYHRKLFEQLKESLGELHGDNFKPVFDVKEELEKVYASKKTYIFLWYGDKKYLLFSENNAFESQYMRKMIVQTNGAANWDWKIAVNEDESIKNLYADILAHKNDFIFDESA